MPFDQQLWEEDGTPSRRKHRVHGGLPGGAVIGMIDTIYREKRLWVAGDEDIWLELTDDADNVAAQVNIRDKVAIGAVHEVDRFSAHTNDLCRGDLLFMADGAQGIGGHTLRCGVVEAFIATGEQLVCYVMAEACPARQSCTAEELGVIGMRKHHKDALRGVPGVGEGHGSESRFGLSAEK